MMSHDEKLKKLVDTLASKTAASELNWELAEAGQGARTNLKSGTVVIAASQDEAGQDAVKIIVRQGDQASLIFDDTAVVTWDLGGRRVSYYPVMKNLLDNAIRAARGEDVLINSVLTELGVDPNEDDVPF